MPNPLFTLILEFEGTNSVSQFAASGPEEALHRWRGELHNPPCYGLRPDQAKALARALEDALDEHIYSCRLLRRNSTFVRPLDEMTNAWCVWLSVRRRRSALINIVATQRDLALADGPEGEAHWD